MKALLSLLICLFSLPASGQEQRRWEQMLADIMTDDDIEAGDWEDTYLMLCELEQQPLDLNTATREQLEQLPFLSEKQVEGIMEYMYHYGPMKSLNELRMIRLLDFTQIDLLRCFTYVSEQPREESFPQLDNILRYGRHELMANARVPFYKREGDRNGYLGYPYRHSLRYQFSYRDFVKWGAVASQDAGEPFFANDNKMGYDHYSYYLQLKHLKRLDNLVVGKYKLSAGMGLVLNNSFGMGKLAMLQQLGRSTNTIRPHSSRSQSGYFRGAAATIRLSPDWKLTGFASYRSLDATLNDDGTAATLVSSGYHRTKAEMEKRNNTHATDAGAHMAWRHGRLHAGVTAVYTRLDRDLQPNTATLYRRHYARGNDFLNVSADYGYSHHVLTLNGETAINRNGALATINSLGVNTAHNVSLMLLWRFFSYRYTALYARTVSEGGRAQNENGLYLGATWRPSPSLSLQAYTDYAYFAWARYQVSQSSRAWDNLLTATYNQPSWSLKGRYRLHLRQRDNEAKTDLENLTEHRGRLSFSWQADDRLNSTTQADVVLTGPGNSEWGYMLSQNVEARWKTLRLDSSAGYFRTTGYDSRLYVYEHGPRYSFAFPAYYGEGLRLNIMARVTLHSSLSLTARIGYTHYMDRSSIGSGLQMIDGSSQTDLDLQVRWIL